MYKLFFLFILTTSLYAQNFSQAKILALYRSLDPLSISEQLAFYELYPTTKEGNLALRQVWTILGRQKNDFTPIPFQNFTTCANSSLIFLINKPAFTETRLVSLTDLEKIESLCSHLANRKLKGYFATTEEEVLNLPTEEIDMHRGLLISQLEDLPNKQDLIRQYEARLDLMALQILARLYPDGGMNAPDKRKIEVMNDFIFNELHFRFPPHSTYSPEIDQYTFLTSVLDSRRGVCLGVSILYLALAQRINLPLEVITPPGHIFVRYAKDNCSFNIETTARGASFPDETYLGITTNSLQRRSMKETIGLAYINEASVYTQKEDYEKAISTYKKAVPYLPEDILLKELMGYHYLLAENREEGIKLLQSIKDKAIPGTLIADSMPADFLNGKADNAALKAIFLRVDETTESLLKKQRELENALKNNPEFRSGLLQLATTWLQLEREKEATCILERAYSLDPGDPTINYYLAALYTERYNYNKAWFHLKNAEKITSELCHNPLALKELRRSLQLLAPE